MKYKQTIFGIAGLTFLALLFLPMTGLSQDPPAPWEVPDEFKNMTNPIEPSEESVGKGMILYIRNCASCHGREGLGDGPKAQTLETFSGDMSSDAYQSQTDGEHFYKSKFGRGEMPSYENKLSDEQIWHLVNYMRTFKK
jgi:mono/diheme cytochrome c family protein